MVRHICNREEAWRADLRPFVLAGRPACPRRMPRWVEKITCPPRMFRAASGLYSRAESRLTLRELLLEYADDQAVDP
jgi:hypothetical protein